MRGEGAPSPIYEGEDSVIARILMVKKHYIKFHFQKKMKKKSNSRNLYKRIFCRISISSIN